jgi:hypothetical protein
VAIRVRFGELEDDGFTVILFVLDEPQDGLSLSTPATRSGPPGAIDGGQEP